MYLAVMLDLRSYECTVKRMPKPSKDSQSTIKQGWLRPLLGVLLLLSIIFTPTREILLIGVEKVANFGSHYLVNGIEKATEDIEVGGDPTPVESTP